MTSLRAGGTQRQRRRRRRREEEKDAEKRGRRLKREKRGGREDGGAAESPGPDGAGVRPAVQGGAPPAAEAAGAQGGAGGQLPRLEVEEPVGVAGPLHAHWDVGPGLVSVHTHTHTKTIVHSLFIAAAAHDLCVCVCVCVCVSHSPWPRTCAAGKRGLGRGVEGQWHFQVVVSGVGGGVRICPTHTHTKHLSVFTSRPSFSWAWFPLFSSLYL